MNKLIAGFALFFFINVILSGILEGGGGIASSRLRANMADDDTIIEVASTGGFLSSSYVVIGSEKTRYVSKTATQFNVATDGRGYDGTEAVEHSIGAMVYSSEASVLNSAVGFNVASTDTAVGGMNLAVALLTFFTTSVPKFVTWNFAHFSGDWGIYVRFIFIAISAGFVIYLAYHIAMALGGILQRIFLP